MRAEVIAIGDEITSGQRVDTNSAWLAAELGILGVPAPFHVTAADTLAGGVEAFRTACGRADVVVATGGLGPTADDLTRDVLAALAGVPLEPVPEALRAVEERFARRGTPMPEANRRQALFPRGSRMLPNPLGTAPGIDLEIATGGRSSRVFALPGVPAEMKPMWHDSVVPALLALLPDRGTIVQRRVKCFGAGESAIEAMLPDLVRRGRDPLVGITVHEATITLRIAARGRDDADCRRRIAATEEVIRGCLGGLVFGVEDDEIEDAALAAARAAGVGIGSLEVGTAGRVAALLAAAQARHGGAPVYRGGTVLVAEPVAAADLAARARSAFAADIGLGVGTIRGAADGRERLEIAVVGPVGERSLEHVLGGGPVAAARAAKTALDLVRRYLTPGLDAVGGGR